MPYIYNSRDAKCKTPFGAVKTGQEITLTLRVPQEYGPAQPRLFLQADGGEAEEYRFAYGAAEGGRQCFTLCFSLPQPGLYFYWFDLWVDYRKLYRGQGGQAFETTGEGEKYALLVYDAAFQAPAGVRGKVMYQIFPDRFFEGDATKPLSYNERIYRKDKSKEPYFWPDNQEGGYLTRDYFGGDLVGIEKKLPFLHELGVDWIYLNPIFEAHANHRYNTADYLNIDPYLGTNEDFTRLCRTAEKWGMKILLDGVFSHTGADSLYFNKEGRYPSVGAWQGPQSPYRDWYLFKPDGSYESWWGFDTLPACDKNCRSFRDFICGEGGVIDTWLQRGAHGFRLDVADELPDDFIREIRTAVKRRGEDNLLIGEVWEDAALKEAYHVRRRYFWGAELDGVMNYPFRNAILRFAREADAGVFREDILSICENYPPPALAASTVHLATHDTERAITALAGEPVAGHDRFWQSGRRLSQQMYELGVRRLKLAMVLQFTLPGIPCVYYGDEVAMQGYKDPFNRAFYEWDSKEDRLRLLLVELSRLHHDCPAFAGTEIIFCTAQDGVVVFERRAQGAVAAVAVNAQGRPQEVNLLGETIFLGGLEYAWRTGKEKAK